MKEQFPQFEETEEFGKKMKMKIDKAKTNKE